MERSLKIVSWNANGLLQNKDELEIILKIKNVDICLISETHFTNQSLVRFKGYQLYHTPHPSNCARGGSAVLVKENIKQYEQDKTITEEIQATAVNIETKNYSFVVASIYCPPRFSTTKEKFIDFFKTLGNRFIVGGDFNAKNTIWGSRLTTFKGKTLLSAIKESRSEFLSTGKPTYWPTDQQKIPDLIDFFIMKNITCNFLHISEIPELNSDHTAIVLILSVTIIENVKIPYLTNKYTNWELFRLILEEKVQLSVSLQNKYEVDNETEKFINDIQISARDSTPEIHKKLKGHNYPSEIREIIREKRKLRQKWQRTRAPVDKTNFNNISQQLRREIKRIKNESFNTYLNQLSNDKVSDYSLWKATKKFTRPIMQIPPIRILNQNWARRNNEKANAFADYLEKIFTLECDDNNHDLNDIQYQSSEAIKKVKRKDIISEIKNINLKKSPGNDLINGEILHNLPQKAITKLTNIINAALRLKYVPKSWKTAEVIMIPKPGKPPHNISSYRPISLLPIMSKIFEKILLKRLKPIIEEKKLIPDHQFGFREQHSTIDQVHRITNVIEKSLEEKKICSTVFLDVAQAFDKVWHKGLIAKLNSLLPLSYTEILQSYLTDRRFRIRQEDAYSDYKNINAGVPQGSVLGPILYLLFTSDIPKLENNIIATFADDTAIMAVGTSVDDSTEKLQSALSKIYNWTEKWKIKLNESKSVHIDFTNRRIEYKPVYLNNQIIPHSNTAKYLGMTLDSKLRWKAHVKIKREELGLKYNKMYWIIGRNSSLSTYNKILIYKQILKPVWTYGIQLWGCTKSSNIDIIQRFQNKVLRNIVNAPWYIRNSDLHRDLQMEDVKSEITHFARSHEQRLHYHVNIEAIQLLDNTDITRRLKRTKPFELT